jgi:chromosome partitioning protein
MPYVIAFVSQKGGVGKSTLARATAVSLSQAGYRVRLCDLDTQQGTSIEWYRQRLNSGGKPLASVEYYGTVKQALQNGMDVNPAFDFLVVDAPGRSSAATVDLAQQSHLIIQPATGTLDDLRPGILLFHELLKNKVPPGRMLFALTRTSSDHEEALAKDYIKAGGYAVLKATLPDSPGYKHAQNEGLSVIETRWESLNQRAQALIDGMLDALGRLYQPTGTD